MSKLECPYCEESIEITWKRYWASASNRYICPKCDEKSGFRTSPRYIQYLSWAFQLIPFLLHALLFETYGAISVAIFITVVPIIYLDKYLDENYGELIKIT